RDDHLGAERAYTGDAAEEFDGGAKGGEVGLNLLVEHRDGCFQAIDLSEMELQQKTMMGSYPAAKRLLQCGLRGLHARMGQRSQADWISFASGHGVEHCRPLLPSKSESSDSILMLASSSVL